MNENPAALVPELALLAGAVCGLLLGSWTPRRAQWRVRVLAAVACAVGLVASGIGLAGPDQVVFDGAFAVDTGTGVGRVVVLASTLLVLGMTTGGGPRETEFCALVQLAALGALVLAGTTDLLLLVAGYLLASIPLYALAGLDRDGPGTEAALKYYLMGALLGVVLLVGVTALFAAGRGTGYPELAAALPTASPALVGVGLIAVLAGVLFKVGAVPAHFWVPDVAQGSGVAVAAFATTVPKIGGVLALHRLGAEVITTTAVDWALLLAVLATASMTLGNLAAFFQDDPKRLLAYSTISQVGYLLVAVAVAGRTELAGPAVLFYLAAYAVTNLGAFAVVARVPERTSLAAYRGLARRRPLLVGVLVVCLLGLVGTPPTGVFLGKLEVFTAALDGGLAWLAVVAVLNTAVSLFYYLRWILPAFLPTTGDEPAPGPGFVACAAGALSLVLGLGGGLVLPLLG
ncbi:NADH-quinone oxidoreductase subunit N [Saccharopolyspora sp. CA-218241]|uniref:NADH-quinone oxidoreductase subunit N n=1 Tax=Saccharopolyspora sp. CA-218241 TaxID=3240027 RepID=UPI003D95D5F9